jgi:serine protease Do
MVSVENERMTLQTDKPNWQRCLGLPLVLSVVILVGGTTVDVHAQDDAIQNEVGAAGVVSSFDEPTQSQKFEQPSGADLLKAMSLTSKAFRSAAKKIEPAMVTIESYGGVGAKSGRIGGIRNQGEGNTTGIMISPDGYILTSTFNFIQSPPVITVITSDGVKRYADLLGRDDTRKICLLKVKDVTDMPVPEMVDEAEVAVGQWAVSLGVGYGDTSPAMSMGIVSAKNRIGGRAIQTDANISPANYGGPLIDIKGRMIGICVPMNPQSQAVGAGVEWYDSGIGFAVPIANAKKLINRLKSGERILPAFLGIESTSNPEGKGLFIVRVVQKTAAEEAGLLREDVLLEVAGEEVNDLLRLRQILNKFESGQTIELKFRRSESEKVEKVELKLGVAPLPEGEEAQLEPPKIR